MSTTRTTVWFPSGEERCEAWLYRPEAAGPSSGPRPIVVMAHGLGAVKAARLDVFADRFAAAGYLCLVFDYRTFGGSTGQPRELLDIRGQEQDWRAAVEYARNVPGADPERVVVWGTSFSGGHAITTAAGDRRIAAAVAQCSFTDGWASRGTLPLLTQARLELRAVRDLLARLFRRGPVRVRVAGAPGEVALMNAPDVLPGYRALQEAAGIGDVEVAARVAMWIPFHRPGRRARAVSCPILFAVCEQDSVAPPGPTLRYAARAPRGTVRCYPRGHFDIYFGEAFEQVVTDELEFLTEHVPPR